MTAAYMNSGDLPNLVAAMEAQAAKRGLSADRLALLARLNLGSEKPPVPSSSTSKPTTEGAIFSL